jgi:hypothetical protein
MQMKTNWHDIIELCSAEGEYKAQVASRLYLSCATPTRTLFDIVRNIKARNKTRLRFPSFKNVKCYTRNVTLYNRCAGL